MHKSQPQLHITIPTDTLLPLPLTQSFTQQFPSSFLSLSPQTPILKTQTPVSTAGNSNTTTPYDHSKPRPTISLSRFFNARYTQTLSRAISVSTVQSDYSDHSEISSISSSSFSSGNHVSEKRSSRSGKLQSPSSGEAKPGIGTFAIHPLNTRISTVLSPTALSEMSINQALAARLSTRVPLPPVTPSSSGSCTDSFPTDTSPFLPVTPEILDRDSDRDSFLPWAGNPDIVIPHDLEHEPLRRKLRVSDRTEHARVFANDRRRRKEIAESLRDSWLMMGQQDDRKSRSSDLMWEMVHVEL